MTEFNMNLSDVYNDAFDNYGGTYAFENEFWGKPNFGTGYMVSLFGLELKVPFAEFALWRLNAFVDNRRDEFNPAIAAGPAFLGIWITEEDGTEYVYMDISVHFEDEEKAEAFARDQMQLAYWDCKAGIAITL